MTPTLSPTRPGALSTVHPAGPGKKHPCPLPALAWTAMALFALSVPTLLLGAIDDRMFQGVSVWTKPWKFQVSIGLHLLTLAVVFTWLPRAPGPSPARWYVVWVAIGSGLFELAYITWQAAWGQASHFNVGTPLAGLMYSLMIRCGRHLAHQHGTRPGGDGVAQPRLRAAPGAAGRYRVGAGA